VLAALIVGSLVAAGMPSRMADGTKSVVCSILDRAGCQASGSPRSGQVPPVPAGSGSSGGCHGFWGCAWSGTKNTLDGAGGAVADMGKDLAALVTTNPLTTGANLGKYLWSKTGGASIDAVRCGNNPSAHCTDVRRCAAMNGILGGCLLQDMTLDDQVKDDYTHGRIAHGTGRLATNVASFFIPTKIPGLNKIGRLSRAARAAEEAEKADSAPLDLRRLRDSGHHPPLPEAEAGRLLDDFTALGDADKTAFLGKLTPGEVADLYRQASADTQADLLAHASPDAVRAIDPSLAENPGVHWTDISKKPMFDGDPKVADVQRGAYGTCWCLAGMAALADRSPALIRKMIKENPNGTVTVTFGDGHKVTVTPEVPMDGAGADRAAWAAIMEKAFAQRHGSYERVGRGGSLFDSFEEMTGKRPVEYLTDKPSLSDMARDFRNGHAFAVGFQRASRLSDIENHEARGITPKHAYAVVDVDENARTVTLANSDGPAHKTVTLTEKELQSRGVRLSEVPTG
jgi:hypothetical protein